MITYSLINEFHLRARAVTIKNRGRELKRRCRLFDTPSRGRRGGMQELISRGWFFSSHPAVYIDACHLPRRGLPIVARKFIRKIPGVVAERYGERGFDDVEERDIEGGAGRFVREEGEEAERHKTDRQTNQPTNIGEKLYYTIESEIDNSSARPNPPPPSLHLLYPVCQSRPGVIGDAECANCRRSTTRIYRVGRRPAVDGPRHVVHVSEIKDPFRRNDC